MLSGEALPHPALFAKSAAVVLAAKSWGTSKAHMLCFDKATTQLDTPQPHNFSAKVMAYYLGKGLALEVTTIAQNQMGLRFRKKKM